MSGTNFTSTITPSRPQRNNTNSPVIEDESPVALIVGCTLGGIVLLALIVVLVYLYKRRKRPSPINGKSVNKRHSTIDTELENGQFNPGLDASVQGLLICTILNLYFNSIV